MAEAGKCFRCAAHASYTGILTEFARRQRKAIRSLHPTKSVCAIGPAATELTATHHLSPYPYDTDSPYYKLIAGGGEDHRTGRHDELHFVRLLRR